MAVALVAALAVVLAAPAAGADAGQANDSPVETQEPPTIGVGPAQDMDGDGYAEDVRGDGKFDIFDVQIFFSNLDNPVLQNHSQFFAFGQSDPAAAAIFDVQALFTELREDDGAGPQFAETTISDDGSTVECSTISQFGVCNGEWEHELDVEAAFALDDSDAAADRVTATFVPSDADAATATHAANVSGADAAGAIDYNSSWSDPVAGRNCNIDVTVTYRVYQDGSVTDAVNETTTIEPCSDSADGEFTVSNLSPQNATVESGTQVSVTANVTNVGDEQQNETVRLTIGDRNLTTAVALDAGATQTVAFQLDTATLGPGQYTHTVATRNDSASGTLVVTQSEPQAPAFENTSVTDDGSTVECTLFGAWGACAGEWEHELAVDAAFALDDPDAAADNVTATFVPSDADADTTTNETDISDRDATGTLDYDSSWSDPVAGRNCNIDVTVTYRVYDDGVVTDAVNESVTIEPCSDSADGEFTVSDLSPQNATVESGTQVNVTANVTNTGDQQQNETVKLAVGDRNITTAVALDAGASELVTFQLDTATLGPGQYTHTVATANDSASGFLTVTEAEPQAPAFESTTVSDDGSTVECTLSGAWGACAGEWEHELAVDAAFALDDPDAATDKVTATFVPSDADAATATHAANVSGADAAGAIDYNSSWSDPLAGRNCNIDVTVTYKVYQDGAVTDAVNETTTIELCSDSGGSNLTITNVDAPDEIEAGNTANVSYTIENSGQTAGSSTVALSVDGDQQRSESVTVEANSTVTSAFAFTTARSDTSSVGVEVAAAGTSESATVNISADPLLTNTSVTDNSE